MLLALQSIDLALQNFDIAEGLLDAGLVALRLAAPAVVVVDVLGAAALLGLDLEAQLALFGEPEGLVDHLHAAGLAGAVLGLAVLAEVAPLPVAAGVDVLFVEAHGGVFWVCFVDVGSGGLVNGLAWWVWFVRRMGLGRRIDLRTYW
jgi:hypothetical protein